VFSVLCSVLCSPFTNHTIQYLLFLLIPSGLSVTCFSLSILLSLFYIIISLSSVFRPPFSIANLSVLCCLSLFPYSSFLTPSSLMRVPQSSFSLFIIPCSSFLVPHSLFLIPCSSFLVPHSSYLVHLYSFLVLCSFLIALYSFLIPHSSISIPCSLYLFIPNIHSLFLATHSLFFIPPFLFLLLHSLFWK